MGKVTSLQPILRFSGFNGDWSKKWLGSVCSIGDVDHWMPQTVSEGIPYLMTGDFVGINELDFANAKLISETDYGRLSRKIKPEYGDILFARYASVGAVRYVNTHHKFQISYSCAILKKPRNYDSQFLFYNIQSPEFQKKVELEINTGSQRNIGIDSLKKIEVFFPNNTVEQTKIGDFFQNVDQQIKLHQDKHNKLQQLKKAMLGKMFPKAGKTVPEVRFSGFSGEWSIALLGENARFTKGKGYSKSDLTCSGIPIILYGRLYTNYQVVISEVNTFVNTAQEAIKSKGGEVIVPASGETAEDIARASAVLQPDVILGGDLNIIYPNQNLLPGFLALVISYSSSQRELAKKAQGKSVVHVRNSDLKALQVPIPSIEEQVKISEYFQNLDNLIALKRKKIYKLQNIKQSCLGKMFV
ncbi:restriction endonuclease subunit S [Vibrio parahaemolyticus]|nr:restriction endonuclease subunit S [Vibrio parahaemolyticus]HCH6154796.1 restriction endonuclease subunit S [Vibrio parahaemolyticus]